MIPCAFTKLRGVKNSLITTDCVVRQYFVSFTQQYVRSVQEIHMDVNNKNVLYLCHVAPIGEDVPDNILEFLSENTDNESYEKMVTALNTNENTLVMWTSGPPIPALSEKNVGTSVFRNALEGLDINDCSCASAVTDMLKSYFKKNPMSENSRQWLKSVFDKTDS